MSGTNFWQWALVGSTVTEHRSVTILHPYFQVAPWKGIIKQTWACDSFCSTVKLIAWRELQTLAGSMKLRQAHRTRAGAHFALWVTSTFPVASLLRLFPETLRIFPEGLGTMFLGPWMGLSAVFCKLLFPLLVLAHYPPACVFTNWLWFQTYPVVFSAAVPAVPEWLLRPVMETSGRTWQQSGCTRAAELALFLQGAPVSGCQLLFHCTWTATVPSNQCSHLSYIQVVYFHILISFPAAAPIQEAARAKLCPRDSAPARKALPARLAADCRRPLLWKRIAAAAEICPDSCHRIQRWVPVRYFMALTTASVLHLCS